jgi:hypothetical protein
MQEAHLVCITKSLYDNRMRTQPIGAIDRLNGWESGHQFCQVMVVALTSRV